LRLSGCAGRGGQRWRRRGLVGWGLLSRGLRLLSCGLLGLLELPQPLLLREEVPILSLGLIPPQHQA
jgi:hypothetical protein